MQGTSMRRHSFMQEGLELRVDQSEHHHSRFGFDTVENVPQLTLGAHQRPQMLHALPRPETAPLPPALS